MATLRASPGGMQVLADKDAAKTLGEYLLTVIAAAHPMQALHIGMSELPGGEIPAWALAEALEAGTRMPRMRAFRLPGGDLFMFAEKWPGDTLRQLRALLAGRVPAMQPDHISAVCHIYDLPDDAVPLRRLIKSYLTGAPRPPPPNAGPASSALPVDGGATADPSLAALSTGGPEGPLTLDLLDHFQDLVNGLDVAPFIHQQAVLRKDGGWAVNYIEHFIDVGHLLQTHFPAVDLTANEGLSRQFCRTLDDLMLAHLLTEQRAKRGRIGIKLSLESTGSSTFKKFADHLSGRERRGVVCELHWLEVLQDVEDGGRAVGNLSGTGFALAMDRITMPLLPYLNLTESAFEYVKVRFDRASIVQLRPQTIAGLRRCPPAKIVLTGCDDRRALALGEQLRIGNFQGPLLDEMMTRAA